MLNEKVSMRRPAYMGRPVMYILQTVVVCGVVCMCLSSTVGTGWWSERRKRMSEEQGVGGIEDLLLFIMNRL